MKLITRREAAALISAEFFAISPRTLETWDELRRGRLNGRILLEEDEVRAAARRRIKEAKAARGRRAA